MAEDPKSVPISTGEIPDRGVSDTDDSDRENLSQTRLKESTFNSTEDPRFYRPIDSYEGLHRWDPYFDWTEDEERKIVRKVGSQGFYIYASILT